MLGANSLAEFAREQSRLLCFAKCREEIIEVEGRPGIAVFRQESVFQFATNGGTDQGRVATELRSPRRIKLGTTLRYMRSNAAFFNVKA